ncbi:CBL-interacting protein kinase 4 [Prunus dulcis]|uniref:non-specific serine/threonine protein kinase n=1 Tax=Prunus dulcis TaxID=3755 RepID=A0A4Y1QKT8_PRUDU|nr:CBL-interacting protein kinase 4 [Prunus dulcis]
MGVPQTPPPSTAAPPPPSRQIPIGPDIGPGKLRQGLQGPIPRGQYRRRHQNHRQTPNRRRHGASDPPRNLRHAPPPPPPNILKIHEVLATKSKIYLVVELATGGELFAKISRHGKLPESLSRRYFQQLVSALHFCHQNGVAHRDVKPQNLLLDKNGNLKVSDFGLSALPDQLKNGLLQTACGTPAYTAPEVVYRRGYDGSKADAWSCGVILFVLLAGRLPFEDNNLAAMYKKVQRREYEIPGWISKPAGRIIYQLLDPNPNTRLGIEALMEKAWFKKSMDLGLTGAFEPEEEKSKCDTVPCGMNAFDIISMSSGLDLSGLFEVESRMERRFTAEAAAETVVEKVAEVGERLGYKVEKGKSGVNVGLGKRGKG